MNERNKERRKKIIKIRRQCKQSMHKETRRISSKTNKQTDKQTTQNKINKPSKERNLNET